MTTGKTTYVLLKDKVGWGGAAQAYETKVLPLRAAAVGGHATDARGVPGRPPEIAVRTLCMWTVDWLDRGRPTAGLPSGLVAQVPNGTEFSVTVCMHGRRDA